MSNKAKLQQQQQSSQQQQQQQQSSQVVPAGPGQPTVKQPPPSTVVVGLEPLPPRYQPPPQPAVASSGIIKPQQQSGIGYASQLHHHHHSLHHQHQQQAARLANQVKDAVQSKFAQKVELPPQVVRSEKLQQQQGKSYLGSGVPTLSGSGTTTPTATGAPKSVAPIGIPSVNPHHLPPSRQQQQQQQQRLTDDEFLRLGPVEMLKFVRKTEGDMARLVAEQHRQIQALVNELRVMKEANQRLSDDNQELRDLCCFLDDDRQKGRKLAREWQRFGRYTASVMRQEVSAYQNKLRQLDNKQQELIKDNLELKELCLYLDEERGGGGGSGSQRDDGDGSSSSTNADESTPAPAANRLPRNPQAQQQQQHHHNHHHNHHQRHPSPHAHHPPQQQPQQQQHHVNHHHQQQQQQQATFNDQTMQYVRSLEQRVKQLEEDSARTPADDFHLSGRPEAVVRALQVLEVRESLEREAGHDGEKALVREMCNVVWRKLEEGPAQNRH